VDKISGVVLKNLFMSTFHHEFCHQMAAAVGLDVTKKHYTNHSIRKTTVKKLKKDGVSATEVMAITAHKNQQILADYDELDNADHMQLSRILSSEKLAASKQLAQVSLSALLSFLSHLQLLNPLISVPNYSIPSAPVFNNQNSTVILDLCLLLLSLSSFSKLINATIPVKERTF